MKFIHKLILIAGAAAILPTACADLDGLNPINEIPSESAIVDKTSAAAALNGVYNAMQLEDLYFDGWMALAQYYTDEAVMTGTFPTRLEFDNINVFPSNGTMAAVFTGFYQVINTTNNVIALTPALTDPTFAPGEQADFAAQARFVRALTYLQLVNCWKDVPLILEPLANLGDALFVPKNAPDEIYLQIIRDLDQAANDLQAVTSTNRASKQAANALLARVHLYRGNWTEAKAKAEAALGPDFDLTAVPFLEDQIFSLAFTSNDGNVLNFYYGPSELGGRYEIGPSPDIIAAFEADDRRFAKTLDTSSASVPYVVKYPSFSAGISGTATDPIFFIRHAEMVLILAEAAAETGDFTAANKWFGQVRQRAGLPAVTLNAANFVDRILQERFIEFAFEGSFRMIDLRRKGKIKEKLGPQGYEDCDDVWPLPQREVDRNPNLKQNRCCNC